VEEAEGGIFPKGTKTQIQRTGKQKKEEGARGNRVGKDL